MAFLTWDIQCFLGLAIFNIASSRIICRFFLPLTSPTKQDVPFEWTVQAESTFITLGNAFTTAPILTHLSWIFQACLVLPYETRMNGKMCNNLVYRLLCCFNLSLESTHHGFYCCFDLCLKVILDFHCAPFMTV